MKLEFNIFSGVWVVVELNEINTKLSSSKFQCNTNIFEYLIIWHQILDIRIRIVNFLVTNIFNIRI